MKSKKKEDRTIYTLKQIVTPRLMIRPVQLGDEIQLNKAITNSLESLQKWMPWAKDPSIDATRDFVQRGVFSWESGSVVDFPMVVIHKADQKIICASGFNDRSSTQNSEYEIGYWCDSGYQGQGLITECVNALTRYAIEALQAKKVVISMQVENTKSIAVAERLGFCNEGMKNRDPNDCVSDIPAKNYIYSRINMIDLPDLKASWDCSEKINTESLVIDWASKNEALKGDVNFKESAIIIKTPWSSVIRLNVGEHDFYLKHMPEKLSLEAQIIKFLSEKIQAPVPVVIDENKSLHCFLMQDAGTNMRSILKKQFNKEIVIKGIEQFISLQIDTSNHINNLLEIGVPDWRIEKMPMLLGDVLSNHDILIEDGLTQEEYEKCKSVIPITANLCQKLSKYMIKPTIVQPDFNDNNMLINQETRVITHIDLGEVSISHPFFSLINMLYQMNKHYDLKEEENDYQVIKNTCLESFQCVESKLHTLEAFGLAEKLWPCYSILGQYRLILACDKEKIMSFKRGKLSNSLRTLMALKI